MNWFKKQTKEVYLYSDSEKHESLVKEVQNLRLVLKEIENRVEDLKLELWVYKTIAPKIEYRGLYRQRGPLYSYEKDAQELEAKGWHIKRVSDCGKYEIWMPGKVSEASEK